MVVVTGKDGNYAFIEIYGDKYFVAPRVVIKWTLYRTPAMVDIPSLRRCLRVLCRGSRAGLHPAYPLAPRQAGPAMLPGL
jgi:hypothetical protein